MDNTALALVVAALGVVATPITAWMTYQWSRGSERERWQREREVEGQRWERQERDRRVIRGEEAAGEILTIVDRARMLMTDFPSKPQPSQFEPFYHDVRRLAEVLTDDDVRDRIFKVSEAMFYYNEANAVADLNQWSVARAYAEAAHEVIRAYLLARPCPDTPRLARLSALIDEGSQRIAEQFEDGPDPLDSPVDVA